MITIQEVPLSQKNQFNKLALHPVQSWEWGDFREKTGNKILRLGIYENGALLEVYLMTLHNIPKTKYFVAMCAKCPAPGVQVLKALKENAKTLNIIFIRFEPNITITDKNSGQAIKAFHDNGAKLGKPFFNKSTFVIDLEKSENELLKLMHPKTRYNIRVAERHNVTVEEDSSPEAFAKYLDLMDETTRRQHYFNHTEKYHKTMWGELSKSGMAHLLNAKYNGKTLITWILFIWHDTLYYPYGASSSENRQAMAAHKMMWEAVKFGKSRGLKKFDLWGRDEGKGFTRFKEGFNPEIVEFIGTWDVPINLHLYTLYCVAESIRSGLLKARAKFIPTSSFR